MAADNSTSLTSPRQFKIASDGIDTGRRIAGRWLIALATTGFLAIGAWQALYAVGQTSIGFPNWRPVFYAYVLWSVALGIGLVLSRGEAGYRALFVLPAVLFTIAMAIFPTLFGFYIAFTDWNLSAFEGRKFNGLGNFFQLLHDPFFWNALGNMVFYVLAITCEYAIRSGWRYF
jgi:multiple sugar transport system permease protein